jgi:hypothetical protein
MVMIPTDVGLQVRMQTESATHQVRSISEIPSDLPELLPGQVFRARIQEVLPENSYKAVVAGRLITLSLPEGAKAGDSLELVMVRRSQRSILAQRSDRWRVARWHRSKTPVCHAPGSYCRICSRLTANRRRPPVLRAVRRCWRGFRPTAAEIARELPGNLSRAVTESGMFYEAHQVQWALGQRPLTSLLLEPQGQLSQPAVFVLATDVRECQRFGTGVTARFAISALPAA